MEITIYAAETCSFKGTDQANYEDLLFKVQDFLLFAVCQ